MQTSIELLIAELKSKYYLPKEDSEELCLLIEKYKETHKQEIIDSYKQGQYDSEPMRESDAEQYYNQTFKQ